MERRRMGKRRGAVHGVDLQSPRQCGRPAEQLLVEVVAPPPDRLGQRQRRGDRVHDGGEVQIVAAHVDPCRQRASGDAPPDPEAALPDLQRVERMMGVQLVVGRHVVDPGADQPPGHAPQRDRREGPGLATTRPPPAIGQPYRREHARHDEKAVHVESQRPDADAVGRRARQVAQHVSDCRRRSAPGRGRRPGGRHTRPLPAPSPAPGRS